MTVTAQAPDAIRALPASEPLSGARPASAPGSRVPGWRPVPETPVPDRAHRAAHAVVRMALEVIDRRRTAHQTRGAFPPHLAEMLGVLARAGVPGRDLGPARIHRVHVSAAFPTGYAVGTAAPAASSGAAAAEDRSADGDYEVSATYGRGRRLFAVAARIRVTPTAAVCTALRLC